MIEKRWKFSCKNAFLKIKETFFKIKEMERDVHTYPLASSRIRKIDVNHYTLFVFIQKQKKIEAKQ